MATKIGQERVRKGFVILKTIDDETRSGMQQWVERYTRMVTPWGAPADPEWKPIRWGCKLTPKQKRQEALLRGAFTVK
jgi:hypothetical protein